MLVISYYVIPTIFVCHRKYKINKIYQYPTLIIKNMNTMYLLAQHT